jgi:hypothetical protein
MTDTDIVKAIGSAVGGGAVAGALLLILYRITQRIVERFIAAIDRIAVKVDGIEIKASERHAESAERHAAVREELVKLDAKVSTAIEWRDRERSAPHQVVIDPNETPSERRRKSRGRSAVGE